MVIGIETPVFVLIDFAKNAKLFRVFNEAALLALTQYIANNRCKESAELEDLIPKIRRHPAASVDILAALDRCDQEYAMQKNKKTKVAHNAAVTSHNADAGLSSDLHQHDSEAKALLAQNPQYIDSLLKDLASVENRRKLIELAATNPDIAAQLPASAWFYNGEPQPTTADVTEAAPELHQYGNRKRQNFTLNDDNNNGSNRDGDSDNDQDNNNANDKLLDRPFTPYKPSNI